jgi:hypothetical protein
MLLQREPQQQEEDRVQVLAAAAVAETEELLVLPVTLAQAYICCRESMLDTIAPVRCTQAIAALKGTGVEGKRARGYVVVGWGVHDGGWKGHSKACAW